MSDYYATLRIQQGRLKKAMMERGWRVTDLSVQSNVSQPTICGLLNFRYSPRNKDGSWSLPVLRICKCLCYEPNELFPDHLLQEYPTNRISRFVERAQLTGANIQQLTPKHQVEIDSKQDFYTIKSMLKSLNQIETYVIKARYFEAKTYKEIGKKIDRSPERVRQIERQALICLQKLNKIP